MALPTKPSRSAIFGEFGAFTKSGFTNGSLKDMYSYIFGSTNYSRNAFGGYGKPELSNVSYSTTSSQLTANFTIDINGKNSTVRLEYHVDDNEPPFTGQSVTTVSASYSGSGSKSISGSVTSGQTYYVRLRRYNRFNDHSIDWQISNLQQVTIGASSFSTPSINNCSIPQFSFNEKYVEWNYGSSPSSFSAQIRTNSGSWFDAQLVSSNNWGSSSNPKSATFQHVSGFNPGDVVGIRIKANGQGGTNESNYSAECTSNY